MSKIPIVLSFIIIDQLSKLIIIKFFPKIILFNQGISFGLWPSNIWLIINLLLIIYLVNYKSHSLGKYLIISGGLSNLIDRIIRGRIVDFINIYHNLPKFNLADIFISLGVILIIKNIFFYPVKR